MKHLFRLSFARVMWSLVMQLEAEITAVTLAEVSGTLKLLLHL